MADMTFAAAAALGIALLALWLISIRTGKVSFIDAFWGMGFLLVAGAAARGLPHIGQAQVLYLTLLSLWALRLSLYLLRRFLAHGEDKRYVRIIGARVGLRRHLFTLGIVFGLQGVLVLLISAPSFAVLSAPARAIDGWAIAGAAVWALGAFFEWVGDWQLSRFKADPENAGKVMDRGLWAWTRHPNYFGDACVWWGLWLIGHDPYALYAPALMTFLLMKWSGVPILERGLRKTRPGYADYMARTSAFLPWPSRAPKD